MKPEKFLKITQSYLNNLKAAQSSYVAVGLPIEKIGGEIYKDEEKTVLEVGISHEYGVDVPRRSFLKMPFDVRKKEIAKVIEMQFSKVLKENRSAKKALGLIGTAARNVVIEAFRTEGFGTWQPLSELTKVLKDSSKILINTGTLRNSISWVVR